MVPWTDPTHHSMAFRSSQPFLHSTCSLPTEHLRIAIDSSAPHLQLYVFTDDDVDDDDILVLKKKSETNVGRGRVAGVLLYENTCRCHAHSPYALHCAAPSPQKKNSLCFWEIWTPSKTWLVRLTLPTTSN